MYILRPPFFLLCIGERGSSSPIAWAARCFGSFAGEKNFAFFSQIVKSLLGSSSSLMYLVGAHPFHLGIYGQEKKKLAMAIAGVSSL